jgi:hypothetical protein
MPGAVVREKDPRLAEAGRKGMRARWGPQRVLRLDELDPAVRAAVQALIGADQAAKAARGAESEGSS